VLIFRKGAQCEMCIAIAGGAGATSLCVGGRSKGRVEGAGTGGENYRCLVLMKVLFLRE